MRGRCRSAGALVVMLLLVAASPVVAQTTTADAPATSSGSTLSTRFSDDERMWLRVHPVITLSVDDNYEPKNYHNKDGQLVGISIDYIRLIEERLGIEVQLRGSLWQEALRTALRHEVDGVVNADALEERMEYLNFTDVYAVYPQALLTREGESVVNSLSEFSGRRVAVKRDTSQNALLRVKYPQIDTVEVDTLQEAVDLLVAEKVDGVYDDVAVLHNEVFRRFLTNVKFSLVYYEPPVGHCRIGVRNDDPLLVSVLNKAIASITQTDHARIQKKWIGQEIPWPTAPGSVPSTVTLKDEEKQWLKSHSVIRVGSDPAWAPIEFVDDQGRRQGIAIDYLDEIQKRLGVRFEFVEGSWQELIELGRAGSIDMFSSMVPTVRRREFYDFTDSYLSIPVLVFTRLDIAYIGDLNELKGRKTATLRGYAISEWLQADYPDIELVNADTVQEALKMLRRGEVDAYIGAILTTSHHLHNLDYMDLKVAGDTPYVYENRMAVRKDWPILAGILDKAIKSIPQERKGEIYGRWVTVKYEHDFDYSLLWKLGLAELGILFLALSWSYRLSKVVATRTTDLAAANTSLSKREAELKHAQAVAHIGSWYLDYPNNHLRWSDETYRIFGLPPGSQPSVELFFERIHPDDREYVYQSWEAALRGDPYDVEHRIMVDGESRWITQRAHIEFDKQGRPTLITGIVQNISEEKHADEERRELQDQLYQAQKMEIAGQLAGGVAHDFNNLLTVILANIEQIENSPAIEHAPIGSLSMLREASEQAANVTKALLLFSRKLPVDKKSVDLCDIVRSTGRMMSRMLPASIELEVSVPEDSPLVIHADGTQIQQVLMNLTVNARDAMPEGGRLIIRLSSKGDLHSADPIRRERAWGIIEVHDTGTGMPSEVLARAFEPFFSTKGRGRGTGLGLAITHGIVTSHEGHIDAESKLGYGTRFTITLPLISPDTASKLPAHGLPEREGHGEAVLVAEDNDLIRRMIVDLLLSSHYTVYEAADGHELLNVWNERRGGIDLIVSDIDMPGVDGISCVERIRESGDHVPTILITGKVDAALTNTELPDHTILLHKPIRMSDLVNRVSQILFESRVS